MIWIDYVIAALIFITVIRGLMRGLGPVFFSLIFWLLAIGIGLNFSREFSVFLKPVISNPLSKITAAFLLLFLITLIVGSLIRILLGDSIKKATLTLTDRFGGMVFGALHGMVVVLVLVILAGLTALPDDLWWQESTLLPPFQASAIWSRDHIPSGLAEYIHYR